MEKFITRFNILAAILFFGMFSATIAQGQWQSINPGAGGQVQDIVCDPNTPNRVFVLSDMEGFYESTDNGNTWHHKGNLKQNRAYALAVPYGNTSKMFVGTLFGLEVSTDGGNTFSIVTQSKNMSVAALAVDPNNQNNVIAGVGWRDDGDFTNTFSLSKTGPVVLYRSTNGGTSWTTINITDNQTAERNVYTIQFDKTNSNNVYMGTSQGVYKSTNGGASWFPLNNNPGANSGVSLSANGQYLYGTFNYDLYVTSTSSISWQLKMSGVDDNAKYWYPEVDPRDNGTTHKVTMAVLGDRPGLYEGTFNWSGNSVSNYSWKKIWEGKTGYDTGWDQADPNPRVAHYTPPSWSRALWSTSNQTIFQATPDGSTWGWNWNNKYSTPNPNFNVGGTPTYSSKGTASTYTYDVVAKDNYVVQGMADNGFVESWDSGFSWSNIQMRWANNVSDVQAVDIGYGGGNDIAVVVGSNYCYGGACYWGQSAIYTKKLINKSPADVWVKVPGSDKGYDAGLNSNEGRYRELAVSPAKKDRVFFGVNNEGLYMIDDLGAAANGTSNLQFIGGKGMWIRAIAPHPTNADIFFFTSVIGSDQGLYKASKSGSTWSLQLIQAGSGWDSDCYAWMNGSQVMVAYAANIGGEYKYMLSNNGGSSFTTAMTPAIAKSINTPSWYNQIASDYRFTSKGGVAGDGNTMFAVYYDHRMQQTYGIYKGTIASNGSVTWADWSGDVHFGGLTGARVITTGGTKYLYASTAGAGAIRRPITTVADVIPTSVSISGCPGANMAIGSTVDLNETVLPSNATNKSVTWSSSNSSVATVSSSGLVTAVAAGTATITVTTVSGSKTAICAVTVSAPTGGCTASGTILKEKYDAITGTSISDLTGASIYPNSPSSTSQLTSFEAPTDAGDNYGLRVRGFICAPQTGTYTFWIAGDDGVELWLSTTSSETNKVKIASHTSWTSSREWNKFTSQKSTTISLTAGQSYYIEALMKEGTGGDNLAVGWRKPSDGAGASPSEVIPGSVLSPSSTTAVIPTSVSISGCPGSSMAIGATVDLNETVSPSNATNKNVTWSSSNTSIATVSSTGLVTAVAAGSATITVTTVSGGKTATCAVTVSGGSSCTNANLVSNGEFDNALTGWSTYSGQNGSSATSSVVNNGGLSGTNSALISITNGGTVGNSDIQFWNHVSLTSGKTYEVIYKAKAASNRTMRVQLHLEGGAWTGYGEHTMNLTTAVTNYSFEVTMSTTDTNARLNFFLGGNSANVWIDGVIVREKCVSSDIIPTSVSIVGCPGANMNVGGTVDLNETVLPSNATNKSVTWSSSNAAIATVNSTGLVTAVAAGSATITVTTVSGSKTATCVVNVSAPCTNPSIVSNGEFDSGTTNWQFYVNTGASANASLAVVTGAGLSGTNSAKVTITNGAAADSDVQLYSNLSALTSGKTYQVIFKAKSDGSRTMRVGVLGNVSPWTNFLSQNVNLTTAVQDYTLEFTMNQNNSNARVDFFVGNNANDVWVDAVIVKEKCAEGLKASNSTTARLSNNEEQTSTSVIYPNPISIGQVLTIDLGSDVAREVRVLSVNGQVIFSRHYDEVSIIELPVAETGLRDAGMYYIHIQTNTQHKVQKLIIK